jgi:hypothetical protein
LDLAQRYTHRSSLDQFYCAHRWIHHRFEEYLTSYNESLPMEFEQRLHKKTKRTVVRTRTHMSSSRKGFEQRLTYQFF